MNELKLPPHIVKFLTENFPADGDLAGYVICIAKRDKTLNVVQHMALWEGSAESWPMSPRPQFCTAK